MRTWWRLGAGCAALLLGGFSWAADGQTARELVAQLGDMRAGLRAAGLLEGLGVAAVPDLVDLLREPPSNLPRAVVVEGSAGMPAGAGVAVAGPGDRAVGARWHAVRLLARLGPAAADAAPTLAVVVQDRREHAMVRLEAAHALGRIHAHPEDAVPALSGALADPLQSGGETLRGAAAEALGLFGQAALSADPALRRAMGVETDPATRTAMGLAIDRVHRPSAEELAALAARREQSAVHGLKEFRDPVSGLAFDYPEEFRAEERREPDGTLHSVGLRKAGETAPRWPIVIEVARSEGITVVGGTALDLGWEMAQRHCEAVGPDGEVRCPEATAHSSFETRAGRPALELVLTEEEERLGTLTRRPKAVFVVDISPPGGMRALLLMPEALTERSPEDVERLREIARSVRLAAPTPAR